MLQTGIFNYVNILNRTADASWARLEVIANNYTNADTPNYKRQDIDFSSVLEGQLKEVGGSDRSLNKRVATVNQALDKLQYKTYTDMASYSYRIDGNNVDEASEQAEAASEQIHYQGLTYGMTSEFNRLKTAMS